ncbi:hypothetical protein [Pantoea agglomerans]|uniref:hypothetical protein n=1 Tax=Enterobacter agglomerans TaxID=549 RepID=UPI00384D4F74
MKNLSDILKVDKKLRTFGVHAQEISEHLINLLTAFTKKEQSNSKHRDLLISLAQERKGEILAEITSKVAELDEIKVRLQQDPDNVVDKNLYQKKRDELEVVELKRENLADTLKEMRTMVEDDQMIGADVEDVLKSLKKYNNSFSEDFISALHIVGKIKDGQNE